MPAIVIRSLLVAALAAGGAPVGCRGDEAGQLAPAPNVALATETLASGFDTVWELAWGPDGFLWVTERGGHISRVNPITGHVTRAGSLAVAEVGEGGLMGLAFHPEFASVPFVYAAHTYRAGGGALRNRVVRMPWDGTALGPPTTILDDIPGASVHNGARLAIGPDRLLYVTTGDAGDAAIAQNTSATAGKVLRVTLDGAPAPGNPFGNATFSFGHRNPQGLVFTPDGALFVTEHGPGDNDEVNRVEIGRNHGWPAVRGFCDGDAGAGERAFCQANQVVEPLAAWTPTIAPAGLDYYDHTRIADWRGSLLFTALKGAALVRLRLATDGRSVLERETLFERTFGRLRDVLVAPDGSVYLATSNKDGRGTPLPLDDRIIRLRPR